MEAESFLEQNGDIAEPIRYFRHFISLELTEKITEESNKYALYKHGLVLKLTEKELQQFIGTVFYMGIVRMSSVRAYFAKETSIPQVTSVFSRNRFADIARCLHFVDNNTVTTVEKKNKLWKLQPFLDELGSKCNALPNGKRHSIDEMIISFKGKISPIRQYMPNKPTKWGFKIWARCSDFGVLEDFIVYQGKSDIQSGGLGPIGNTVLDLCKGLQSGKNYKVYADNLFTTLPLVHALLERNIFYLGTVRTNRIPQANKLLKTEHTLSMIGKGAFDVVSNDSINCIRWSVTLLTTYCTSSPVVSARRYDRIAKNYKSVSMPNSIVEYNKSMGGVDKMDHLMSLYKFKMISKRWFMYLFYCMLRIAVVNSWLLYRQDAEMNTPDRKPMQLGRFIYHLHESFVYCNKEVNVLPTKRARLSVQGNSR